MVNNVKTLRHRRFGRRGSLRGQTLVELAFLVPLLAGLALGIIELGRYAYIGILIGNAAKAGAIYGSQSLAQSVDTAGIAQAAKYDFGGKLATDHNNGLNVSTLNVSSSVACGCDSGGTVTSVACTAAGAGTCGTGHWVVVVSVTASGTFNKIFNYPGVPASLAISRTASMRVAQN
jgi:Flp pilus assembly protein TadG